MKYVDEFRDRELASNLAANIRGEADASRRYRFMEFCGGHTHAIARYGVADLLPPNVQMIHGPGLSGLRASRGTRGHGHPPRTR